MRAMHFVAALGLAISVCAIPLAAQDVPPPADPPETPAPVLPVPDRAGIAPAGRTLGQSGMLSVREAAALPPGAVLETNASPEDAPIIQSMIRDEAAHRDRIARIRRLRALETTQGRPERLAALDRLESTERQRHEARALISRTQLSEPGFRATRSFMTQGGIMRLRHAQARADGRLSGAQQRPDARAGARMRQPTRSGLRGSASRPAAGNGTSRGGRSRSTGPR
ncbi:MAG: hypothetical protein ACYTG2_07835 [Planctomycetota bacterium]|jgi:hypothetical protein